MEGILAGTIEQRALLRHALRKGDLVAAARAFERMRVAGAVVTRDEATSARAARTAVGRAIRDARRRKAHPPAAETIAVPVIPLRASHALRRRLALALAVLNVLALIGLTVLYGRPDEGYAPAAAAPPLVAQVQSAPTPTPGGKGRTSATAAPVAVVTTPAPTAPPSEAPTGTPIPSGQPEGQPGGVVGGVPGGTPGGVVGGVPGGTGTKTLTPTPAPTPTPTPSINVAPPGSPPPLIAGQDRFVFYVEDASTKLPLGGVCMSYGLQFCTDQDPHTNAQGYVWLYMQRGMATTWSFKFFLDGYYTATITKKYTPGMGNNTTSINLRRR